MFQRLKAAIGRTMITWAQLGLNLDKETNKVFGIDKDVLLSWLQYGSPYFEGQYDYYNDRQELLNKYKGWAYAISNKYGKAVMECWDSWGLYTQTSEGERLIDDTSYLYDIRGNSNPIPMILDYKTTASLMYLGNAFWYMPKNSFSKPSEINFLEPEWGTMRVVKNARNEIQRYVMMPSLGIEPIPFEKETILHFYYPSISSGDYGRAPSSYIKSTLDLDEKYKIFSNSVVGNKSVPPFALFLDRPLVGDNRKKLEQSITDKGGIYGSGNTLIVDTPGRIEKLNMSPQDMDFMEGKRMNRDETFAVNDISKTAGGVSDDVNRANADAGIYIWYRLGVKPFLNLYAEFQTHGLFRPYDPKVRMKYDEVIPEDEKLIAEVNEILIRSGQATPDEIRKSQNKQPYSKGIGSHPMSTRNAARLEDVVNKTIQNSFAEAQKQSNQNDNTKTDQQPEDEDTTDNE